MDEDITTNSGLTIGLDHELIIANPRRVRLIAENDSKSDAVDAELLARLGRVDPTLPRPIVHRGEQAQHDRILYKVGSSLPVIHRSLQGPDAPPLPMSQSEPSIGIQR